MRPGYLDEIVGHYRDLCGERLVGIVLYGSRARGDEKEESDVDLFVLAEGLPEDFWERARLLRYRSALPRQPPVAVRALTPAEYARDISPLDLDIAVDGRVLWDRDGFTASRLALIRTRLDDAGHSRPTFAGTGGGGPARWTGRSAGRGCACEAARAPATV